MQPVYGKTKWVALGVLLLMAVCAASLYPAFVRNNDLTGWSMLNKDMELMLDGLSQHARPSSANEAVSDISTGEQNARQELPSGSKTLPQPASSGKIDINRASAEQLEKLPGIGESRAKAIVAYRSQFGLFQSAEDLMKVKGIGPKLFERMKDLITVETEE
jgi:comEA protein